MADLKKRIGDNHLNPNFVDGQVLLHPTLNEIVAVTKQGINENYYDIQRIINGEFEGIKGEKGASWLSGLDVPNSSLGVDGWYYLQGNGTVWVKSLGIWEQSGINIKGLKGDNGAGVLSIAKTSTVGLVDTYTITFDDDTTTTFTITNGQQGIQGIPGPQGIPGATGNGVASIVKTNTVGLIDTYTITFTDQTTTTFEVSNGEQGIQGDTGNGIASVVKTNTVGAVDTYTITFTNDTTTTFNVTNSTGNAESVSIADTGNLYIATTVEGALAEVAATKIKGVDIVTNAQTDGVNTRFGHSTNAIASDVSTSVILGGGSTGYNNVIGGDGANVNTITPNTTTSGTAAHVSVVGGYDNSAGSLSSKIISDHSKTEIGGAGHNAIYGGAEHVIKSTASFAMIAGGQNNEVSGQGGFATGLRNKSGGTGSACFGYDNVITANGGFTNGSANTVSNVFAQAYGSTNTAAANFSKAEGNFSHTRTVSQQAFTGGRFAALGDAQTSIIEMHRQTTDATTVTLGVLNSNTSHQLLVNQSVAFTILLVARVVGGTDTAAWEIKGMARRGASGNTVPVGTVVTSLGADTGASAWTVAVTGDSAGGLNTRVTGEVGKTIRWVQRMTIAEVIG